MCPGLSNATINGVLCNCMMCISSVHVLSSYQATILFYRSAPDRFLEFLTSNLVADLYREALSCGEINTLNRSSTCMDLVTMPVKASKKDIFFIVFNSLCQAVCR